MTTDQLTKTWDATFSKELVNHGAQLLDSKLPGWEYRINILDLNIASATTCICGQLYGDYWGGLQNLHIRSGFDYGFVSIWPTSASELNTAWRNLITNRWKSKEFEEQTVDEGAALSVV